MKPLIGITVHVAEHTAQQGHREVRYEVGSRYAAAVLAAGGLPLFVATHSDSSPAAADIVDRLDGLLLSGGGSLPGEYFVENPDPSLRDTNPERYDTEVELVRAARARNLPLLGICRGHQTMVEALGGELIRNLGSRPGQRDHYQTLPPDTATHDVRVAPGSRLAGLLGREARVNSFHRQAVTVVPDGWTATAWSDDELIEAVEAQDGFAIGLQFHPEWLGGVDRGFQELFRTFVEAAAEG